MEDKANLMTIKAEILCLMQLHHPNIVRLLDVKKEGNSIYLILEFCNQNDLNTFFAGIHPQVEIRYYFSQVLQAFKYLRKKNIIHRDLKPQNILVNNGLLKVADFGFAKELISDKKLIDLTITCGTLTTIAPQIIQGLTSDKCDIWSLGSTLYWMIYKTYPHQSKMKSDYTLLKAMKEDKIVYDDSKMKISDSLKNVLKSMLTVNLTERIEWDDLFRVQLFDMKLILELGNINVIEQINYDELEDEEEKVIEENS